MTHKDSHLYDVIGVGLGPFNLGLAALLTKVPEVNALFFEQKPRFDWHPGLLLQGTTLQVPFLADLVTMADPTSPFTFLNYLQAQQRLYHFYFLEKFHVHRQEYNHYCQWVADQLVNCCFGQRVVQLEWVESRETDYFRVVIEHTTSGEERVYRTRHLVLGVGSTPYVHPSFRPNLSADSFHTAHFITHQQRCRQARSITVIGSGQSAAEVFYHLLQEQQTYPYRLDWLTRSAGFFPMEYSKLGLEHFSPDYMQYFYHLPAIKRESRLTKQDLLYKGISVETIAAIYDLLYERTIGARTIPTCLRSQIEIQNMNRVTIEGRSLWQLSGQQVEQETPFQHQTEVVIWGTGYEHLLPECIAGLAPLIAWDERQRYQLQADFQLCYTTDTTAKIFVQNGGFHAYGVGTPDLGLGSYRNAVIINTIVGREVYPVHHRNIYQTFGILHTNIGSE